MHPFDIKAVLLAKHSQHVVLIHFPIALFIIGVVFDFLAGPSGVCFPQRLTAISSSQRSPLYRYWPRGISAWQWELEGQRRKGILLMHLVLGCLSSALIWIVWLIHVKTKRKQGAVLPGYRLPIEAVAVAILTLTGHLGGFLSGVNGPG